MTPLDIVYVDDDRDIRHIVALALGLEPGIAVRVATDAEAARALFAARVPDVALLDVMMPGTDGPTLLAQMRGDPATAHVPVIFMTARARPAEVAEYRARGACGVIAKPFDPLRLAGEVRALLGGI